MADRVEVTLAFEPQVTAADLRDRFEMLAGAMVDAASLSPESTHAQPTRSQPHVVEEHDTDD
jgi:hypothetical protein